MNICWAATRQLDFTLEGNRHTEGLHGVGRSRVTLRVCMGLGVVDLEVVTRRPRPYYQGSCASATDEGGTISLRPVVTSLRT